MIFDSHVHTTMSTDADTTITQAAAAAAEKGVGVVITDHMDWDFPAPSPDFRLDLDRYIAAYAPQRSERLLLGIELGVTDNSVVKAQEIIRDYAFDFVLGSLHVMDGKEVDDALYRERDERLVYREYLLRAAKLMRQVSVDAFAHVDYPLRSTRRELPYEEYAAEFDVLFDVLVSRGICLELNTSRLKEGAAVCANMQKIFRAYRARGGRYVTLGSDAHEPAEIADSFREAQAFVRKAGLLPVHFEKRRMIVDQSEEGMNDNA